MKKESASAMGFICTVRTVGLGSTYTAADDPSVALAER